MHHATANLLRLLDEGTPDEGVMDALFMDAACLKLPITEFLDQLSLDLAHQFVVGALGYEQAGGGMDTVYGAMLTDRFLRAAHMPALTLEVYEAFDRGEYLNPERDAEGEDPVEKYTRPLLRNILGRLPPK